MSKYIKVIFYLKSPSSSSINDLFTFCFTWKILIQFASTSSTKAVLLFPTELCRKIFGKKIEKGFKEISGVNYFVDGIEIIGEVDA